VASILPHLVTFPLRLATTLASSEAAVGFTARTIFWLGLVYSAMPLDFGSLVPGQMANLTENALLAPCVRGGVEDCRRRLGELRKALDAAGELRLAEQTIEETAVKELGQAVRVPDSTAKVWAAPPRRPPQ
jgi:hypothetical protein